MRISEVWTARHKTRDEGTTGKLLCIERDGFVDRHAGTDRVSASGLSPRLRRCGRGTGTGECQRGRQTIRKCVVSRLSRVMDGSDDITVLIDDLPHLVDLHACRNLTVDDLAGGDDLPARIDRERQTVESHWCAITGRTQEFKSRLLRLRNGDWVCLVNGELEGKVRSRVAGDLGYRSTRDDVARRGEGPARCAVVDDGSVGRLKHLIDGECSATVSGRDVLKNSLQLREISLEVVVVHGVARDGAEVEVGIIGHPDPNSDDFRRGSTRTNLGLEQVRGHDRLFKL